MPLIATADPGHHHFASIVHFYMNDGDRRVRCGISRWRSKCWNPNFLPQRKAVCRLPTASTPHRAAASAKFDHRQLEPDGSTILVRAADLV